jgi:hypothetical protein
VSSSLAYPRFLRSSTPFANAPPRCLRYQPVLGLEGTIVETKDPDQRELDKDGKIPTSTIADEGVGTIVKIRDIHGEVHGAGTLYRSWVTKMHGSELLPPDKKHGEDNDKHTGEVLKQSSTYPLGLRIGYTGHPENDFITVHPAGLLQRDDKSTVVDIAAKPFVGQTVVLMRHSNSMRKSLVQTLEPVRDKIIAHNPALRGYSQSTACAEDPLDHRVLGGIGVFCAGVM